MELRRLTPEEHEKYANITAAKKPRKFKQYPNKVMIDLDQLEQLCRIQCTKAEIAAVFAISIDTLDRRIEESYGWFGYSDGAPTHFINLGTWTDVYERFSKEGCSALRRAQFKEALKSGNTAMQIWLGKQYLGQRDSEAPDSVGLDKEKVQYDIREGLYND